MIEIAIPGFVTFRLRNLVLDVNGTIAKDGQLIEGVAELLKELRSRLEIHMITADTHGTQESVNEQLGLTAVRVPTQKQAEAKLAFIEKLGADTVVAVGNGANDSFMLKRAALGIVIVGPEGCAVETMLKADVAVPHARAAFELLLYPKRLIATLRR
jgi:P-type E1-E2 ATPase